MLLLSWEILLKKTKQDHYVVIVWLTRMNVATITIDVTFTTRCNRFLYAEQESEIMMILTSVLDNLGPSCVESLYLVPCYCPAR